MHVWLILLSLAVAALGQSSCSGGTIIVANNSNCTTKHDCDSRICHDACLPTRYNRQYACVLNTCICCCRSAELRQPSSEGFSASATNRWKWPKPTPKPTTQPTIQPTTQPATIPSTPPPPPPPALPSGTMYASGNNDKGQLGIGYTGAVSTMTQAAGIRGISQCSSNQDHTLLISGGKVYATGNNGYLQLGQPSSVTQLTAPQQVALPTSETGTVVKVVAGGFHSVVLTSTGNVYTWGSNLYGQLAQGNSGNNVQTPTLVATPSGVSKWTDINAGGYTTFLVSDTYQLYVAGHNDFGQLSFPGSQNSIYTSPTLSALPSTVQVQSVSGYSFHTLVLSKDNTIYSFGDNSNGELGINNLRQASGPQIVQGVPSLVTAIATGDYYSLLISGTTDSSTVWGWGADDSFQTLLPTPDNGNPPFHIVSPTQNPLLNGHKIVQLAAGSSQAMIRTDTGSVILWGSNWNGEMASGYTSYTLDPNWYTASFQGNAIKAATICSGYEATFVVTP